MQATFLVIDSQRKEKVRTYKSITKARNTVDKLDLQYGASRYFVNANYPVIPGDTVELKNNYCHCYGIVLETSGYGYSVKWDNGTIGNFSWNSRKDINKVGN